MGMDFSPNLAMGLSGAGMAAGAFGAYKSAAGQKAALGYQASVADSNAQIADEQARFALMNGQQEEQALRMRTAATMADQKATAAANGVDVGSGSPTELMASTGYLGERDALTLRDNAARAAWAYGQRATGFRNEASMDRATAGAMNPWESGAGSLLTSAGSVANQWYRYRTATSGS